jgi:hypothetical protein
LDTDHLTKISCTARNPAFALQRVGCLCLLYFNDGNVHSLAATIAECRSLNTNILDAPRRITADTIKFTRADALALAISGQLEPALKALATGSKLGTSSKALLLLVGCLTNEQDHKHLILMLGLRQAPLKMRYAWRIAQTCAAYDRSALQRVLATLNSVKRSGEVRITQSMCSLAIAAAHDPRDADAVMWFDAMQQQKLHCDLLVYYLVAATCCGSGKGLHDASRVLSAAQTVGAMSELTDGHSAYTLAALLDLQRDIELLMASKAK